MVERTRAGSKRKAETSSRSPPDSTSPAKRPRSLPRSSSERNLATSTPGASGSGSASVASPRRSRRNNRSSPSSNPGLAGEPFESKGPSFPPPTADKDRAASSNDQHDEENPTGVSQPEASQGAAEGESGDPAEHDVGSFHDFDEMEDEDMDEDEDGLVINLGGISGFFDEYDERYTQLLDEIKSSNPSQQLSALEELAGLLSISQEDSLMGLPTSAFVREFIRILGGTPAPFEEDDDSEAEDEAEMPEELREALRESGESQEQEQEQGQRQEHGHEPE